MNTRLANVLTAVTATTMLLAGCMNGPVVGPQASGEVREFVLEVGQASDTIELYEKNDGSYMRVAAMPFKLAGQEGAGQVPGPPIRVKEGDTVVIRLVNTNPLDHTIHLHGGLIPWGDDGTDYLTQLPVKPGEEFTYTFPNLKAGTYFYHCHMDGAHHLDLGMYGAFIVEERDPPVNADRDYVLLLDEWDNCHVHGNTDPLTGQENSGELSNRGDCIGRYAQDNLAQNQYGRAAAGSVPQPARDAICPSLAPDPSDPPEVATAKAQSRAAFGCDGEHGHSPPAQQTPRGWWPETTPVYDPAYNTFLINGKAFPDTEPLVVSNGETVRLRFVNVGNEIHTMHLHGHSMKVITRDGYAVPAPYTVDTLGIMPGERYDVIVEANNPGYWMLQDHQNLNLANDDHSPGGMMTCVAYDEFHGKDADAFQRALDCNEAAIEILGGVHH